MKYNYMSSGKKGQMEFIVIISLIIIAIVAIVIASRSAVITPPDTSGIPEEGKTIKDSVINLIRAGVKDHMTLLY
ncbi:MAG: hypothetical protein KAS04_01540, partial [Candidatus Aenigmarchaeota archaeon]|nr:hypothetical protein [Candidatus Aenigmarchaeota archaeon]